jgi:hypothetical protein
VFDASHKPTKNYKKEAYITVYFEIDDSYAPKHNQVETERIPVEILKGKLSAVNPMEFDFSSNLTYKSIDFEASESKQVDETTGLRDLQDLLGKSFMYDRNIPQTFSIKKVTDPTQGLIKINPNFGELKDFLTKEYDDFVTVLSSFKKCAVSGEFNLYYKLLIHWGKEDLRPEEGNDSLDMRLMLDDKDHKYFVNQIINPIERDYSKVKDVTRELVPIAQQHWRNCQIPIDSKL